MKKAVSMIFALQILFFASLPGLSQKSYENITPDAQLPDAQLPNGQYSMDIDKDGLIDFKFDYNDNGSGNRVLKLLPQAANEVIIDGGNFAVPFKTGNIISSATSSSELWATGLSNEVLISESQTPNGNFANGYDRYLGVRVKKGTSDFFYGWIRININAAAPYGVAIKDFAVNASVNESINTVPGNNYLTQAMLENYDLILNDIQTSRPVSLTPAMTEKYDQNRFQDERFTYQYAVRRTSNSQNSTNSFTGFIQVIPEIGTSSLQLNSLRYLLLPSTSTASIQWVDENGIPISGATDLLSTNIASGKAYYLKVTDLKLNDVITVFDDITVTSCLLGDINTLSMRMSTFETTAAVIPSNINFEDWRVVLENIKTSAGEPFLYLKNTIHKAVPSGLEIQKSIDVSGWTSTSLTRKLHGPSDGPLDEPICPSSGTDVRSFTYIIKKEKNDRQVVRDILLAFNLNGIGGHNVYLDNMSYLPIQEMELTYVHTDEGGNQVSEIILLNDIIINKSERELHNGAGNFGTGDFAYLELDLPYNLSDYNSYYKLTLNEYIKCPIVQSFGPKKKAGWALVEKHELDCNDIYDARKEFYPSVGENGWSDAFMVDGNYVTKPVRMTGPRTEDIDNSGTIDVNLTEYQTLPQIYNFRLTTNNADLIDPSNFTVNNSAASFFVVLKCDQGLNYTAFDGGQTFSGVYHGLEPSNLALFNELHFVDKNNPNDLARQWRPINPDGQLSPSHFFNSISSFYNAGNYGKTFVFEFKVSDLVAANVSFHSYLFNMARMNFTLETECPTSGSPRYTIEYYLAPSTECTDCILPIHQIVNSVQVDCPGCNFPGGAGNYLTFERQNFGFPDTDKNRIAENDVPLTLDEVQVLNKDNDLENDIRTDLAYQGDIIKVSASYYLTSGNQACDPETGPNTTTGPSPFDNFTFSYLQLDIPLGGVFTPLAMGGNDLLVRINHYNNQTTRYIIPAGELSSVLTIQNVHPSYIFDFSLSTLLPYHDPTSDAPPVKFNSLNSVEFEMFLKVSSNEMAGSPLELVIKARPYFSSTAQQVTAIKEAPQLNCGANGFTNTMEVFDPSSAFLCEDFGSQFNLIAIKTELAASHVNGTTYNAGRICRQGRTIYQRVFLGDLNKYTNDYFPNEIRVLPHPTHVRLPIPDGYIYDGKYTYNGGVHQIISYDFKNTWFLVFPNTNMDDYINDPLNLVSPVPTASTSDGFRIYDLKLNKGPLYTESNKATYSSIINLGDIISGDEAYQWQIPYAVRPECNALTVDHPIPTDSLTDRLKVFMDANVQVTNKDNVNLGQSNEVSLNYSENIAANVKFFSADKVQSPLYFKNPNDGSSQLSAVSKYYSLDLQLNMDLVYGNYGGGFPDAFPTGWDHTYLIFEDNTAVLDGEPILLNPDGTGLSYYMIGGQRVYKLGRFGFDPVLSLTTFDLKISGTAGHGAIKSCVNNSAFNIKMKFLAACSEDPTDLLTSSCYQQEIGFAFVTSASDWTDNIISTNPVCDKQHIQHVIRSTGSAAIDGIQYKLELVQNLMLDQSSLSVTYGSSALSNTDYTINVSGDISTIVIHDAALDPPFISDAVGSIPHESTMILEYDILASKCTNINYSNGIKIEVSGLDLCSNPDFKKLNKTVTPAIFPCNNLLPPNANVSFADNSATFICNTTSPFPVLLTCDPNGLISSAYTYEWYLETPDGSGDFTLKATHSNIVGADNLSVIEPGLYKVIVKGADNCPIEGSINVPAVNITLSGLSSEYCQNASSDVISSSVAGGSFSGLGVTDNGDATAIFTPSQAGAGTHTIAYTIPNSCTVEYVVSVYNSLGVSINTSTGDASLLCSTSQTVTLVASPLTGTAPYSYSWTGPSITSSTNTSTITANAPGWYTVTVTDNNGCSGSRMAEIKSSITTICPGEVCPGDNPTLQLNMGGVVGTYQAQWYNVLNPGTATDPGITIEGDYYAWVVTPACSLKTDICTITFKRHPLSYQIGPIGPTPLCNGDELVLSVNNPTLNDLSITNVIWATGETTLDPITVTGGATGYSTGTFRPEEWEKGGYFIVAIDKETGCRALSNRAYVYGPSTSINRQCYDDNGTTKVLLTASSNISSGAYTWYTLVNDVKQVITDPAMLIDNSGMNARLLVSTAGYYFVENDLNQQCGTSAGIYENMLTTGAPNTNVISQNDGSFAAYDASTMCPSDPGSFGTDYFDDCLDRSSYPTTDLTTTIGKYMVNYTGLTANDWNPAPGLWYSTASPGASPDNFMIVDGVSQPLEKRIWYKHNVGIEHNLYYLFKASLMNIDVANLTPAKQIPQVFLRIIYRDANGNGVIREEPIQIFYENQSPLWLDITTVSLSGYGVMFNHLPMTATRADLEIVMRGGGAFGRDIALDDIELIPIGICDDISGIISTSTRNCGAQYVSLDNTEKYTCHGVPVMLNAFEIGSNPDLRFTWRNASNNQILSDADNNPHTMLVTPAQTTHYTLTVDDLDKQCTSTMSVTVYVVTPVVHISSDPSDPNVCLESDIDFMVDNFVGIGGVNYQWMINNAAVSNATTRSYTGTGFANGDVVTCQLVSSCTNTDDSPMMITSNPISIKGALHTLAAGTDVAICTGESVELEATGGVGYSWAPAESLSDATLSNPVATPAVTTVYTVTAEDANGCEDTDEVTVTVNPIPVIDAGQDVAICEGSSTTLTATGGVDYSWSPLEGLFPTDQANTTANPLATKTYTVIGTDANNCSGEDDITVTVHASPVVDAGADRIICVGNTVQLNATSDPNSGGSWSWSGVSAKTANPLVSPAITTTYIATYSISYPVSVTCTGNDDVMVGLIQVPSLSAGSGQTVEANTGTLPAGATVETYEWYKDGQLEATTSTNVYTWSGSGSFMVKVNYTGTEGACQLSSNSLTLTTILKVSDKDVKIYPIPASSSIELEFSGTLNIQEYKLINVLGQQVREGRVKNNHESIKIEGLAGGMYLLLLTNENGITYLKNVQVAE